MLGMCKWLGGDLRGAVRSIEYGVEMARRSGHLRAEMVARETLGLVLGDAGEDERALEELTLSLEQARKVGSRLFVAAVAAQKAEVLLKTGRLAEARAAAADLSRDHERTGWFARSMVTPIVAWLAPTRAEMNATLDDAEQRQGILDGIMMMLFHARAAQACFAREDYDRATRHAHALVQLNPDARSLQRLAEQVLALGDYVAGSRDPVLLARISRLRSEAELGGYGTAVATIDRALGATS
jgi:tetratricopeptide (TPR) repeat protein